MKCERKIVLGQTHRALEASLEALRHHEDPEDDNTDAEEEVAHG
jgi:hypothetical protein